MIGLVKTTDALSRERLRRDIRSIYCYKFKKAPSKFLSYIYIYIYISYMNIRMCTFTPAYTRTYTTNDV